MIRASLLQRPCGDGSADAGAGGRTDDQIGRREVQVAAAKAVDQPEHPGDAGDSAARKHEGTV